MTPWPRVADQRAPFPEPRSAQDHQFRAWVERLFLTEDHLPLVERAARARGVHRPFVAHKVPLGAVPELPSEATLVRLATDFDPACGCSGLDLVLGPLADEPQEVRTLQVAVALAAFFRGDDVLGPPYQRWQRSRPAPPREQRAAVRAVATAPLAPWVVDAVEGDHVFVHDELGLAPMVCPDGPVLLRQPATPFGPLRSGMLLVARIAPQTGSAGPEWVATCPLAVPGPLPAATTRWMQWLAWELRLTFRGPVTRTVLLAKRGHVVARRILEGAWARS